jgi:subtilisin family serine protease
MRRFVLCAISAMLAAAPVAPAAAAAPSDPLYELQWGLRKIGASAAWTVTKGRGAVVAVVDTGADYTHPDLTGRLLPGHDFLDGDADATDDNGHGTLIAGIVAAATSNDTGIASVAPSAKILPVRVLGADGTGSSETVAAGIRWAVRRGADVVNLSLAQESSGSLNEQLLRDPEVDNAIKAAARGGAVVVIAAGNNPGGGQPDTAYDATTPGVLVVGATTATDARAAYSDYGAGLDLVAPGGGSASNPADAACKQSNAIVSTWWDPKRHQSSYGGGCGTSMSVGFVSGVAALLHARGMNNTQIADRILATARDVGTKGPDDETGAGRLDAARALGAKPRAAAAASPALSPKPTVGTAGNGAPGSVRTPSPSAPVVAPPHEVGGAAIGPLGGARADESRTRAAFAAGLLLAALAFAHGALLARRRARA